MCLATKVSAILCKLKENRKVAMATHNIMAYRIHDSKKQVYIHDCDDDGESAAGSRLLHLLEVCLLAVCVPCLYMALLLIYIHM